MRILSIGNSFSHDAHKWLHKLAHDNDENLETVNLFIAACSLKMHWENFQNNSAAYDFQPNGNASEKKISIIDALELQEWDIITLQQESGSSGLYETYEPYFSSLISIIRDLQPNAKIYFHQTWAYEIDSTHSGFANYNKNQTTMYKCIQEATKIAAQSINAPLIMSGKIIQILRETLPEFDYKNGGLSLCRDGFHLSLDYGRFAVAATWLRTLTGKEIKTVAFEDFDSDILRKIVKVVNENV